MGSARPSVWSGPWLSQGGQNTSMARFWDVATRPPNRTCHHRLQGRVMSLFQVLSFPGWSVLVGLRHCCCQSLVLQGPSVFYSLDPLPPGAQGHRGGRGRQPPWHTSPSSRRALLLSQLTAAGTKRLFELWGLWPFSVNSCPCSFSGSLGLLNKWLWRVLFF